MQGRTFSREFKLGVVREIAAGSKRPAQACREYQIAESLLLRWRREYEERGEEAFTPRQASRACYAYWAIRVTKRLSMRTEEARRCSPLSVSCSRS